MTEHKFTDDEIINSLVICSSDGDCKECHINPHKGNYGFCTSLAIKAAIDLINRQKAEVSYWQDEAMNAKREAVKEFAEIAKRRLPVISPIVFDGIAKEIVEDRDE